MTQYHDKLRVTRASCIIPKSYYNIMHVNVRGFLGLLGMVSCSSGFIYYLPSRISGGVFVVKDCRCRQAPII